MAYLTLVAVREGRVAGFLTIVGVTIGLTVYLLASVAGLADLAQLHPIVYAALRWAGVVYLIWLAFETWRDAGAAPVEPSPKQAWRLVARGFLANILNPKAAVLYISLLPDFIRPERGDVGMQALLLGGIHLTVATLVHCVLVLAPGVLGARVLQRMRTGMVRGGFTLGLLLVAAWLAWSTQPR
jgi:threonine/homoserine/homoserine lactone efflux protein